MKKFPLCCFLILFLINQAATGAPKSRDQQVIEDRDTLADNATWIYNDLTTAKAEAAKTGKPMLVVFRCIP